MTAPPDRCDPTALSVIRLTPEEYRKAIAAAEAQGFRAVMKRLGAPDSAINELLAAVPAPPADGGDT